MAAPIEVLSEGSRWLVIATCLRGRELTFPLLVAESGRTDGALWRQLQDMVAAGLVETRQPGAGGRRGSIDTLSAAGNAALARNLETTAVPGSLPEGLKALDVRVPSLTLLAEVLREADLASMVAWATELDGTGLRFLVAFRAGLTAADRGRIRAALESAGADCAALSVGETLTGAELERSAASWRLASLRVTVEEPQD
jgi:hypothetical protein